MQVGVVIAAMKVVLLLRAAAQRELGAGWMAGVCNGMRKRSFLWQAGARHNHRESTQKEGDHIFSAGIVIYLLNNWFSKIAERLTDWCCDKKRSFVAVSCY